MLLNVVTLYLGLTLTDPVKLQATRFASTQVLLRYHLQQSEVNLLPAQSLHSEPNAQSHPQEYRLSHTNITLSAKVAMTLFS